MPTASINPITIQQLECLYHLVAEHSFSRAARKMRLTQPSLSKHIQNLESFLGAACIVRQRDSIHLTPEGNILYEYACRMLQLRSQAEDKIQRLQQGDAGNIDICASTIPATYILPRLLPAFASAAPRIHLHIHTATSEEVMDRVLNRQSEIGLVGKKPLTRRLAAHALWPDELILVVPPNHPWCGRTWGDRKNNCQNIPAPKPIPAADLLEAPFILRSKGSATRDLLEQALKDRMEIRISQLHVIAEVGGSEAVKEAILAGAGVSILSIHAVARELRQRHLYAIPIENLELKRYIYLIYRRQHHFLPHQQLFLNFLQTQELSQVNG